MLTDQPLRLPHGFPGFRRIVAGLLQPRLHCPGVSLLADISPDPALFHALANGLLCLVQLVPLIRQSCHAIKNICSQWRSLSIWTDCHFQRPGMDIRCLVELSLLH